MRIALLGALLLFQGVALGSPSTEPGDSAVNVREVSEGLWRIEVSRSLSGREAQGAVQAVVSGELDRSQPPHALVAGAMAWSKLASDFLEAGDAEQALQAARKGIEELGEAYASPTVLDDSFQRLVGAEMLAESGRVSDGAAMLVSVLEQRINQYYGLHESTLRRD